MTKIVDKKLGSMFDDIKKFKTQFHKDWGITPIVRVNLEELQEIAEENG